MATSLPIGAGPGLPSGPGALCTVRLPGGCGGSSTVDVVIVSV